MFGPPAPRGGKQRPSNSGEPRSPNESALSRGRVYLIPRFTFANFARDFRSMVARQLIDSLLERKKWGVSIALWIGRIR